MVRSIRYDADALPEDSTPAWTRTVTAGGATSRSVSGGLLTVVMPVNPVPAPREAYTISVQRIPRGTVEARFRHLSAAPGHTQVTIVGFSDGTNDVIFSVDSAGGPGDERVLLTVGDQVENLGRVSPPDVFHVYRLVMINRGRFPRGMLYLDDVLLATVTSTLEVVPDRVAWDAVSLSATQATTAEYDYVRYRLGGGMRVSPRRIVLKPSSAPLGNP